MAERVKALATKMDNLSSIPGTIVVEGENEILQAVLWPLASTHVQWHTRAPIHAHTQNK